MKQYWCSLSLWCYAFIAYAHPHIQTFKTHEGTPVLYAQTQALPIIDISIAFYAGSAYDHDTPGLSALVAQMIDQGTIQHDAQTLAECLANVGTQFSSSSDHDHMILHMRLLNTQEAQHESIACFAEMISQPIFPKTLLAQKKRLQLEARRQRELNGSSTAEDAFFKTLYPHHPYAHPQEGTPESLEQISSTTLKTFQERYLVAHNGRIVIVGDVSRDHAEQLANQLTHGLRLGKAAPPIPDAQPPHQGIQQTYPRETTQTILQLGTLGLKPNDPDRVAFQVGNHILGGATLHSLLNTELRERRGLTYGIYSQIIPLSAGGAWFIQGATVHDQKNTAHKLILKTLRTFIHKGPDATSLTQAKQYLKGSFPLSFSSNENIARILLTLTLLNLPLDYLETYPSQIEAITAQDIQRVFQKHIDPNQLIELEVGPS